MGMLEGVLVRVLEGVLVRVQGARGCVCCRMSRVV